MRKGLTVGGEVMNYPMGRGGALYMFTRCIGVIECGYMSDTSINDNIDNEVDVLSEYFEVKSGDVYYTFKGGICSSLKGGVNNVLYGKTINLSEMYGRMMDDVIEFIVGGGYMASEYLANDGCTHMYKSVRAYTTNKYGVSIQFVSGVIGGGRLNNKCIDNIDTLYSHMIEWVGGVARIDWMRIYDHNRNFVTNHNDILLYLANRIIGSSIYRYFVDRYKLRAVGMDTDACGRRMIVLEWDGGRKLIALPRLAWNKRDWWRKMTCDSKGRLRINDYDRLLNGRSEDEVLPEVCPIDSSVVMNYTGIDFSVNGDSNFNECKAHNGMDDDVKTWSFASIDRIDSTKEYDYDNVEVISGYYNTQVKNCASISQVGKLYYYQLHRLLGSKINKDGIKTMSDGELDKIFDNLGVYVNIIEIVHEYRKILFKELNKRDKKRSKLQLVDPGEIG